MGCRRRADLTGVLNAVPALRIAARADGAVFRVRRRVGQAVQPPAVAVHAHAAGTARGRRVRAGASPGQGLREAAIQHHFGQGRWCRHRGAGTGCRRQAVLPPAALQALHRRRACARADEDAAHRAGCGATVGPPCHALARHGQEPAARPQGLRHRLDRRAHGAARCRRLSSRRLRSLCAGIHPPHRPGCACDLGLPAHRAGPCCGVTDGLGRRAHAAHHDHDGWPH